LQHVFKELRDLLTLGGFSLSLLLVAIRVSTGLPFNAEAETEDPSGRKIIARGKAPDAAAEMGPAHRPVDCTLT